MSGPWTVAPGGPLRGEIVVPGDKSVSHRAVLFHLLARRPALVRGLLGSEDVAASVAAARALGATVTRVPEGHRIVPPAALREPEGVLDCGNSGTTMRLVAGIVASAPIFAALTGDASLRRRPMGRVVNPLRAMGARIDGRADGDRAPFAVRGPVHTRITHELPVASAQVVTALLLAGRKTGVAVHQPAPSRDHSQRLLAAMGATITESDGWIELQPVDKLDPVDVTVPGDLSSAAFWLVAASIVPGSELTIRGVGVNPTRTGALDVLRAMGAKIDVVPAASGVEPVADLHVRAAELRGTTVSWLRDQPENAWLLRPEGHTVTAGDTLTSVAQLYGTTRTTLRKLNPAYADYREWPGDAPLPLGAVLTLFAIRPSSPLPAGESLVVPLFRPSTPLAAGGWLFLPRRRAAASSAPEPDL